MTAEDGVQTSADVPSGEPKPSHPLKRSSPENAGDGERESKRPRYPNHNPRFGGNGKKREVGRKEWQREKIDKRARNNAEKDKRAHPEKPSVLPAAFAQDEIDAEEKRPKRKVAVMVGYSGTGYRGMQIAPTEKTIEGDLFTAFVKAGAISKANADDPKKSSLVRCARTDKGVHAAGNMISLKLIVEDPGIVEKINEHLSPQIRVWGIERTTGSFSCYQSCDSRWYEYLLPTHALLPPHPSSFLSKKIKEIAIAKGDWEQVSKRQADVEDFWAKVEEDDIKPILDELDPDTRDAVKKAFYPDWDEILARRGGQEDAWLRNLADIDDGPVGKAGRSSGKKNKGAKDDVDGADEMAQDADEPSPEDQEEVKGSNNDLPPDGHHASRNDAIAAATKRVKQAYNQARRRYRIDPARVTRLQITLDAYVGTRNFHNYTVLKPATDPSAKRTIKSFVANPTPIIINGTEWLSLKVHGQSFMMHQIRKMVGMAALLVRCGADGALRVHESYQRQRWSIPKVPGLGLLLERPVFDSYNENVAVKFDREPLDFAKYEAVIEAFKRSEIYERIWREEAESDTFHQFFNHIDSYTRPPFMYLTSAGWEATQHPVDWRPAEPGREEQDLAAVVPAGGGSITVGTEDNDDATGDKEKNEHTTQA